MLFKNLFVWGPNPFNNKLFASQLYGLSGALPTCISEETEIHRSIFDDESIIFCDCDKKPIHYFCTQLARSSGINGRSPSIALLNVDQDAELVEPITRFKIRGVFYATDDFENITKGLDMVIKGEYWFTRELLTQTLEAVRSEKNGKYSLDEPLLTKRETEILYLIVAGFSNQNIADKLVISSNTVKTHVSNLYKKIDATNRVQAVLWATEYFERTKDLLEMNSLPGLIPGAVVQL
ncbi:LuxR C-terminal-related transcriptional regulator [Desulfogranum mediterraneum]|uniref:LuxR C-terminal-related transcriptional regulator n=1 Tax=Desulfogranum mediterraneum TaxID=160661 RepID=UPI0003FA38A7|nr:LuxR C-terminal-related transcriptional regulator [Desulfogranum mediterraneum]